MADIKVKKYKVLTDILYKGKCYKEGETIDSSFMDQKTIDRLESADYLKEDKGFPPIPKKADVVTLEKLIMSLTEQAKKVRQKDKKEIEKLRKEEKNSLAMKKDQISKQEYAASLGYIEEIKTLHSQKIKEEK